VGQCRVAAASIYRRQALLATATVKAGVRDNPQLQADQAVSRVYTGSPEPSELPKADHAVSAKACTGAARALRVSARSEASTRSCSTRVVPGNHESPLTEFLLVSRPSALTKREPRQAKDAVEGGGCPGPITLRFHGGPKDPSNRAVSEVGKCDAGGRAVRPKIPIVLESPLAEAG